MIYIIQGLLFFLIFNWKLTFPYTKENILNFQLQIQKDLTRR